MRILLVEDERPFAGAVRRGLEADGFVVELATDGNQGLRLATSGPTTSWCWTSCCRA